MIFRSWRVLSNLFYPYPLNGNFKVNGVEFDLMDGVFGLAVGPVLNGDRKLFFHSLASVRESWVSTRVLRNESHFAEEPDPTVSRLFHVSEPRRTSQSAAEVRPDQVVSRERYSPKFRNSQHGNSRLFSFTLFVLHLCHLLIESVVHYV